jgi:hypothetical protein
MVSHSFGVALRTCPESCSARLVETGTGLQSQSIVARKKKCKVFVSYSRHDEALVKPLASLLGAAANDAVFFDVTSLKAGDLWEEAILGAVKEASVFILCWCCESEKSQFVGREISAALSEGSKKLVPVLFCSMPLPPHLASRQWTDLRGKVIHDCPNRHPQKAEENAIDFTLLSTPRDPASEMDDDFNKKAQSQSGPPHLEQTQNLPRLDPSKLHPSPGVSLDASGLLVV